MQERPIPGDGNCQFASLSDQLFGTLFYADAIRANIVGWLRRNGDLELVRFLAFPFASLRYFALTVFLVPPSAAQPNGAKMREFVHTGTWDEYCSQMVLADFICTYVVTGADVSSNVTCLVQAVTGTWGDHLTLVAASELFGRPITIISSVNDSNFMADIVPRVTRTTKPIFLSHYAEFHYTSIVPSVQQM
jgi:hypothetical protein